MVGCWSFVDFYRKQNASLKRINASKTDSEWRRRENSSHCLFTKFVLFVVRRIESVYNKQDWRFGKPVAHYNHTI